MRQLVPPFGMLGKAQDIRCTRETQLCLDKYLRVAVISLRSFSGYSGISHVISTRLGGNRISVIVSVIAATLAVVVAAALGIILREVVVAIKVIVVLMRRKPKSFE